MKISFNIKTIRPEKQACENCSFFSTGSSVKLTEVR